MASKKIKDLAVKTGSYVSNGETKNRYINVGSMMKSDDGSVFLLLNTTFNPAGVPNPENRDNVLISVFDLRDDAQKPTQQAAPQRQAPTQQASNSDDIPF